MQARWPQAIITLTGLLLAVVGSGQIIFQVYSESISQNAATPQHFPSQSISASPTSLSANTWFVGLEVILVGALLQIVGLASTRPWSSAKNSN